MNRKVKVDQIPSNADQIYIKLYCTRKGDDNEETREAARKSWLSLSNYKKKIFEKTAAKRNLINYAHGLSKTKVYMKKTLSTSGINESNTSHLGEDHAVELYSPPQDIDESPSIHEDEHQPTAEDNEIIISKNGTDLEDSRASSPLSEIGPSNLLNGIVDRDDTPSIASSYQISTAPLIEPTPPTIRRGRELFYLIKPPGNPDWLELTVRQRKLYNSAVLSIKREYIRNYMKFLESLDQQQFFNHYMKTLR